MAVTVVDQLHWVRTVERLRSLLPLLQLTTDIVGEVHKLDPELAPELTTILNAVLEAQRALGRACVFMDARLEAKE